MRATTTVILALAAAVVAACQTGPARPLMSPYDAADDFGYSTRQLADGRYEVVYQGQSARTWAEREKRAEDIAAARGLAYDLALWRAAELAGEKGFAGFTVEGEESDVEVEIVEDAPYYGYPGPAFGFHHFGAYGPFGYAGPAFRSAWLRARVSLTVALTDTVAADVFDAAETAARLEAKYPGALTPPSY